MEDDHGEVIEKLKTAVLNNDAGTLRETLDSYPEAINLVLEGVPLLHFICKQVGVGEELLQAVLETKGMDVNQASEEVSEGVT